MASFLPNFQSIKYNNFNQNPVPHTNTVKPFSFMQNNQNNLNNQYSEKSKVYNLKSPRIYTYPTLTPCGMNIFMLIIHRIRQIGWSAIFSDTSIHTRLCVILTNVKVSLSVTSLKMATFYPWKVTLKLRCWVVLLTD